MKAFMVYRSGNSRNRIFWTASTSTTININLSILIENKQIRFTSRLRWIAEQLFEKERTSNRFKTIWSEQEKQSSCNDDEGNESLGYHCQKWSSRGSEKKGKREEMVSLALFFMCTATISDVLQSITHLVNVLICVDKSHWELQDRSFRWLTKYWWIPLTLVHAVYCWVSIGSSNRWVLFVVKTNTSIISASHLQSHVQLSCRSSDSQIAGHANRLNRNALLDVEEPLRYPELNFWTTPTNCQKEMARPVAIWRLLISK